jgi:hypothetical protein
MIDNLPERRTIASEVDFTMMYTAHDAFSRHLEWVAEALERDGAVSDAAAARWLLFETRRASPGTCGTRRTPRCR